MDAAALSSSLASPAAPGAPSTHIPTRVQRSAKDQHSSNFSPLKLTLKNEQ